MLTIEQSLRYHKITTNSKFFLLIKLVLYIDTNMEAAMKLKIFQKGFNYSQDGQGNRLILHLQGCNMKCPWCSNPEGMPLEGALFIEKDWLEESCCPKGAVSREDLTVVSAKTAKNMPVFVVADKKESDFLTKNMKWMKL